MDNTTKYEIEIDLDYENSSHTQLLKNTPDGSDVLELGCTTGFVTRYLKNKGCSVTGIEIDPEAARHAEKYCEKIIVADIDKLDFKKDITKKYDVITFGDVLEHLKEPAKVLEYVKDLLKDGGFILASIPNIGFGYYRMEHLGGNFSYEERGILDKSHLRFFDKNQVFALFESAGCYVKSVFRVQKYITSTFLKDKLVELGLDASDSAIGNLRELLDFEVFQYFVKAYPASEKSALKLLREKEAEYITQIKDLNERLYVYKEELEKKEKDLEAHRNCIFSLREDIKYPVELEKAYFSQKAYKENLEKEILIRDELIHELREGLKRQSMEMNGLFVQMHRIHKEIKEF